MCLLTMLLCGNHVSVCSVTTGNHNAVWKPESGSRPSLPLGASVNTCASLPRFLISYELGKEQAGIRISGLETTHGDVTGRSYCNRVCTFCRCFTPSAAPNHSALQVPGDCRPVGRSPLASLYCRCSSHCCATTGWCLRRKPPGSPTSSSRCRQCCHIGNYVHPAFPPPCLCCW